VQPYNFTSSPSTPRLEALRLEGIVARRSLHGSTTSLQSCLKDPLRDEDSGSLHSAGSRVSFSEDVRVRPISSRGKGRPVGSSSPRTTARSALDSTKLESSKSIHSARAHCHDSPQASSIFDHQQYSWCKQISSSRSLQAIVSCFRRVLEVSHDRGSAGVLMLSRVG